VGHPLNISSSALPYLLQELKLLRWRRGKGRRAGVFVLVNPGSDETLNNKVTTHFIVQNSVNAEDALKTLRLLIRMRRGSVQSA
jgi:hypothetical protein